MQTRQQPPLCVPRGVSRAVFHITFVFTMGTPMTFSPARFARRKHHEEFQEYQKQFDKVIASADEWFAWWLMMLEDIPEFLIPP